MIKRLIIAIVFLCLCAFSALAQNTYSVKGFTVDTASKVRLDATVTVLNAKDSVLRTSAYAGDDGAFSISGLPAGKFLLLVTYPDYPEYVEAFTLDATHKEHNFGNITMTPEVKLLQEVMIKGQVTAIKIKGDTTQFNAAAYTIQPNDKVEDLIKKLPGMQVDKNGKITFNGEQVKQVLLDGEEFFGDDPTLVTRNIRADMVDKLLVYDKKSDQAAFTGVDDGVKTKTIDVKLKEDKKNGVFGKVAGALGTGKYTNDEILFNKFAAKQKYSVYATDANDGTNGLNEDDANKLGTNNGNIQIGDGGMIYMALYDQDQLDNTDLSDNGLPVSRGAGVHFDSKWNDDKESINTNYRVGSLGITTDRNNLQQTTLPTSVENTNTTSNSYSYTSRQKVDVTYQQTIDPTSNYKIQVQGLTKDHQSNSSSETTTEDGNGVLKNRNIQSNNSNGNEKSFNASLFYTKRFKKPGQTLSWALNGTYDQVNSSGYLKSDVYTPVNAKDSLTNQYKPASSASSVFNSNVTYSQPLFKAMAVVFNYGTGLNNSSSNQQSYNQAGTGQYNILDTTYSNSYKFNVLTNQVGAIFNYKTEKVLLNFGTRTSAINFKQIDEYTGDVFKRNFVKWEPQAWFQYKLSTARSFFLNYRGYNIQPRIDQIQPVKSNQNPLNIILGNPDLKPSFWHNFYAYYNSRSMLNGQYFSVNGNFSFTTNAITNNTVTDTATLKSTTQYINLVNKTPYNYLINTSIGNKIKSLDIDISGNLSANHSVSYAYTNNALSANTNQSYSVNIRLGKSKEEKYDLSLSAGPQYTLYTSSLQPSTNSNAFGFHTDGSETIFLPAKFQIMTDLNYDYSAKTTALPAIYRTMWNASINKTFFKADNLQLSLIVHNILDQDQNNRYQYGNVVTQSTYNTIKRYFMFKVTWNFTKFGTTTAKK